MPKQRTPAMPKDIAVLQGPTEDGEGARMLRFKEGAVFAGEVRPAKEGQPVEHHELVRLRPMHPQSPVCAVEVLHTPAGAPAPASTPVAEQPAQRDSSGPARVSNQTYRRNWNAIFGGPSKKKPRRSDWSVN